MNGLAHSRGILAVLHGSWEPKFAMVSKVFLRGIAILIGILFLNSVQLTLALNAEKEAHDKTTELALLLAEQATTLQSGLFLCAEGKSIRIKFDQQFYADVDCKRTKTNVWTYAKLK